MSDSTDPPGPDPWDDYDSALLRTCNVMHDFIEYGPEAIALSPTTERLVPGERILATGQAELHTWDAPGDGTYESVRGGGLLRMPFNIAGNSMRRAYARARMEPRWFWRGDVHFIVTTDNCRFRSPELRHSLAWDWPTEINFLPPAQFTAFYPPEGDGWPMGVKVEGHWAALAFLCAAMSSFPAHPVLVEGTWLPEDWEERCAAHGVDCPVVEFPE